MTANRRIALNFIATYGRSLYALFVGLIVSRWTLLALGQVDFGLIGLVGGLTVVMLTINNLVAAGIGRFYAVAIGLSKRDPEQGLINCREWFTTAVCVHAFMAVVLTSAGYIVGRWFIETHLEIPTGRLNDALWVWKFSCVACFTSILNVPFQSMYTAKQEIAELTLYSFFTTTANFLFMWYVIRHPGSWMVRYSLWTNLLIALPQVILSFRALIIFPECSFHFKFGKFFRRAKELVSFSGWLIFGYLGGMFQGQGIAVVINRYFGVVVNAASTVGNSLSAQCATLSGCLTAAFSPAIMNQYGAGDLSGFRTQALRVCKIGTLMLCVFAIPLMLEVDEVLRLWLVQPPMYAGELCVCVLASKIIDNMTTGHQIAVIAVGRIAWYQITLGSVLMSVVPLAILFVHFGFGVLSIGYAIVVSTGVGALGRVFFAAHYVGLSIRHWFLTVFLPLCVLCTVAVIGGAVTRFFLAQSFYRVVLTTLMVEAVILPLAWFLLLCPSERNLVKTHINMLRSKVIGRLK